jgi:hypothetical protein
MKVNWRDGKEVKLDPVEKQRVNEVMELLELKEATVIDSYSMSQNGPILSSLFLLSDPYLCEIRITDKHLSFDVSPFKLLNNYRVSFGEHSAQIESVAVQAAIEKAGSGEVQKIDEIQVKKTKFVTVELRHTDGLGTRISYFGEDLAGWIKYVLNAYPISTLEI